MLNQENRSKWGGVLFGFFLGMVMTWGYGVTQQNEVTNIILGVVIGIVVGIALTYFAIYKLVGHAAQAFGEDEENDPDWWKKGNKPPY